MKRRLIIDRVSRRKLCHPCAAFATSETETRNLPITADNLSQIEINESRCSSPPLAHISSILDQNSVASIVESMLRFACNGSKAFFARVYGQTFGNNIYTCNSQKFSPLSSIAYRQLDQSIPKTNFALEEKFILLYHIANMSVNSNNFQIAKTFLRSPKNKGLEKIKKEKKRKKFSFSRD